MFSCGRPLRQKRSPANQWAGVPGIAPRGQNMGFFSRHGRELKSKSSQQVRRQPTRFRPRLEALEDRWLPSQVFTVNSATDDPSGPSPGTVTLRDAINAVNADTGSTVSNPDHINFAIGSGAKTITLGAALPAL